MLELGCGTGNLTELLASMGYDMIGVDCSGDMLGTAMEKRGASVWISCIFTRICGSLSCTARWGAVCSVCDSLNYILEEGDMVDVFSLVNNYLYPGGIFVFDFNTVYKYEQVIGDATIAENRDDCSFIWENYYDAESQVNEYDLTVLSEKKAETVSGDLRRRITSAAIRLMR